MTWSRPAGEVLGKPRSMAAGAFTRPPAELRRPYKTKTRRKEPPMADEQPQTAYERLQRAAAKASKGAGLLALRTLKDVHWECIALEQEWADSDAPGADEVRATLARIRTKLAPATTLPWGNQ